MIWRGEDDAGHYVAWFNVCDLGDRAVGFELLQQQYSLNFRFLLSCLGVAASCENLCIVVVGDNAQNDQRKIFNGPRAIGVRGNIR